MRASTATTRAVLAMLGLGVGFLAAADRSAADERPSPGWYLAAGVGVTGASGMEQAGWNRDTTCYPDDDCGHLPGGAPRGYRWFYDLAADRGAAVDIAVGRTFGPVRLEVAFAQRRHGVEQAFSGATYLEGVRLVPAAVSDYESSSAGSVDDLTTRTVSVNAYRDVPFVKGPIQPYVGAGIGLSAVELSGLYYEGRYQCRADAACEDPGQYDGRQDVDMSDIVPSGHLYAGADMDVGGRFHVDVKLAYSLIADIKDESAYEFHKVPGLTSTTAISGIRQWSLMLGVRYRLDR